jgi:hypothetical protein
LCVISVNFSFCMNPEHVGGNQEASSFIHSLRMCCALMTGSPLNVQIAALPSEIRSWDGGGSKHWKYITFSQHLQISHCFHRNFTQWPIVCLCV